MDNLIENEKKLDKANKIINEFKLVLKKYKNIQKEINDVSKYYGSKEWFNMLDEYNKGNLKNVKAGILSEDEAYDMLTNNREVAIEMLKVATSVLENN